MDDYSGIDFLDKLYQNLYMSDEVQHTKENSDNRKEAIQKYMDRLERIHKTANTDSKKELLYNLYIDKYVIKEDNIPDYMDKKAIINGQKKSLGMWLEYLSDETADYPTWAKYWAFQGMLKMGSYDENKGIYLKRNKKTIAPFVSANPEIIAKSIETIIKLVNKEEIDSNVQEKLSKTDSFNKIYSVFEKKYKENIIDKSSTDGIWIKYNQGSKEEAIKLSKTLENKNTNWCTASETMAIKQVCGPYENARHGGDFYVYYTKDKEGKYTVPRIAIRLSGKNKIGEIRGIEEGQNLEEVMTDALEKKLKEMTFLKEEDIKEYLEKIDGLRELTRIGKKTEKNELLTEEELVNIYTRQYGFGWRQDPKVIKIQNMRDKTNDYNLVKNKDIKVDFIINEYLKEGTIIDDKEIMLKAVKQNPYSLKYASEKLRDDKEVVLESVKRAGSTLKYASNELKGDKEVVLSAAKISESSLKYASDELKRDRKFVLEAVNSSGLVLGYVDDDFKKDREVVLAAIRSYGTALGYADKSFRKDKNIVLEAVRKNGYALEFASDELKKDRDIVAAATNTSYSLLKYADKELKNNQDFMLEEIKYNPNSYEFVSKELKKDPQFMLKVIEIRNISIGNISEELFHNKTFILGLIDRFTPEYVIDFLVADEIKKDPDIIMKIAKKNPKYALCTDDSEFKKAILEEYRRIKQEREEKIAKEKSERKITFKKLKSNVSNLINSLFNKNKDDDSLENNQKKGMSI